MSSHTTVEGKSQPTMGTVRVRDRLHGVGGRDRWPWLDSCLATIGSPLGVLLSGAVCSLLSGLFVAPQGYAILAVVLATTVAGAAWPWIAVRGLDGTLTFTAHRGHEGRPTQARVTLSNRWPFPVWGLTVEGIFSASGPDAEVALACIRGWSKSTYVLDITPTRRGVFPDATPVVATGFPFGLVRSVRPIGVERRLVVWPETFELPPLTTFKSISNRFSDSISSHTGRSGVREGLREFRRGDSLRDIHWSKSATYDRLVVSERQGASRQEAVVTVDVAPERHYGVGRDSSLEWALRLAASLCKTVVADDGAVELRLGSERVRAAGAPGSLEKLLDAIASHAHSNPPCRHTRFDRCRLDHNAACFEIGTRPSLERRVRSIVLDPAGFGAATAAATEDCEAWMVLRSSMDVAGQLRAAWGQRLARAFNAS